VKKSDNSPKSAILLLGILGALIILTLVAVSSYFLLPSIEHDLEMKLKAGLSKVGIFNSEINISGRDITLNGLVSSKSDAVIAEIIANKTWGVRQVTNSLSIISKESE